MNSKIAIYTRAYNTKKYLRQCIESVLSQTYDNFVYILVDNGCTDGSSEIIREYAEKDDRICRVRFEQNQPIPTKDMIERYSGTDCEYITILDSDDWWEKDYLERMLKPALEYDTDIISTGSLMHFEENGNIVERRSERQYLLTSPQHYADLFSAYHVFFRTIWGKLIRRSVYINTIILKPGDTDFSYGTDTLSAFALLRNSKKLFLDNSALYHYRINKKSASYQYNPGQSRSDIYLYNDAINFLSPYGPISEDNQIFLHRVYANAVSDTLANIVSSDLAPTDRLEEYFKILERKVTKECYGRRDYEDITNNKAKLFFEVFKAFSDIGEIPQKWHEIFTVYFPKCHSAISIQSMKLALTETALFKHFINDDAAAVMEYVCDLLSRNKYSKQFDLTQILQSLAQSNPLISSISDSGFLKKYSGIYLLLYQSKYEEALDQMTDVLLKEKVNNETFLQTYLNLAALSERVDEFIFGKIKTAGFYLSEKRLVECRETLDEISEMGVEDNEEISEIKAELNG